MNLCPLATLGLPQTVGDHPLPQGLGTQAMSVTLVELLRRQGGTEIAILGADQPSDLGAGQTTDLLQVSLDHPAVGSAEP